MEQLKSCPFCGGEARVKIGIYSKLVFVRCSNYTSCKVNPTTEWFDTEKKAIEAWNRRAKDGEVSDM